MDPSTASASTAEPAPLRILYHHRTQGRGAEGLHIARIVEALREMGHAVTVLSPPGIDPLAPQTGIAAPARRRGAARLLRWFAAHLPGFVFELAEIAYNLPAWYRLRRALAAERYDLVYERYAFYLVAGAALARRAGVPFVLEANEVNGIELRRRPQHFPRLCGWFERYLFDRCDAIHTVSSYLKARIVAAGVPPARVHVAPNAFDLRSAEGCERSDALVDRFALRGFTTIGFVGWFSGWDRLDFLIDVFASLPSDLPPTKLLLVGDGPMVGELRALAARLGVVDRVVFAGPVPRTEVYRHMALLDVAVLPHSNAFGSPVVMFELMGLGIPLVMPRLGPILDVHGGGGTALLFEPLDAGQCRDAIARLVRSREAGRAMAERSFRLLVAEHSWRRNAERALDSVGLAR